MTQEEKLNNLLEKEKKLKERIAKEKAKQKEKERKQRSHRLIQLGAEIESIFGIIPEEDRPAFHKLQEKAYKVWIDKFEENKLKNTNNFSEQIPINNSIPPEDNI